jgi:hypothetical protein
MILFLQWNRDVVVPSHPEEPHQHGLEERRPGRIDEAAD